MKHEEALRLANCCLPKLFTEKQSLPVDDNVTVTRICGLWSGMGSIYRLTFADKSIAVKHIPAPLAHPDPTTMSFGDCRKATAYQIETNFYEYVAPRLQSVLNVPECYYLERDDKSITMCLEWVDGCFSHDLDSIQAVLTWLATLHVAYWGIHNDETMRTNVHTLGSYWHLDTRPEEHADMKNHGWEGRLKRAARAIDGCLKRDSMQCLIHGDAKDANILLRKRHQQIMVTLVDFQYCGLGPPTRDLAYFLASSVDTDEYDEEDLVDYYYQELLKRLPPSCNPPTLSHLKESLELAYCDFCRFQCGWGYWGSPIQTRAQAILAELDHGKDLGSEEAYDEAIRRVYW